MRWVCGTPPPFHGCAGWPHAPRGYLVCDVRAPLGEVCLPALVFGALGPHLVALVQVLCA